MVGASLASTADPRLGETRATCGALSIRGRRHDFFDEAFDVPAVVAEIDGQPIEQFGMARVLALGAEVGGGGDDAGAEEDLPEAIYFDAGGERMLAHRDPLGEAEAVGAGGRRRAAAGSTAGVLGVTFSVGCE